MWRNLYTYAGLEPGGEKIPEGSEIDKEDASEPSDTTTESARDAAKTADDVRGLDKDFKDKVAAGEEITKEDQAKMTDLEEKNKEADKKFKENLSKDLKVKTEALDNALGADSYESMTDEGKDAFRKLSGMVDHKMNKTGKMKRLIDKLFARWRR